MPRSTSRLNRPVGALTVFGLGTAALGPAVHGQIRFDPPREFIGGHQHVTLADLNGNGHLDAAAATANGVQIFFNDGNGTLVHEVTLLEGVPIIHVRAGDVDGDGHVDLVMLAGQSGIRERRLHVFYNDGDGRQGELHSGDLPGTWGQRIAVGDFTGNGRAEVIYGEGAWSPKVWLFIHRERGVYDRRLLFSHPAFEARVSDIVLGDVDGDGDLDAVVLFTYGHSGFVRLAQVVALFNEGQGPPRHQTTNVTGWIPRTHLPTGIAFGDLDGDGDLDLAIVAYDYDGVYYQGKYGYDPSKVGILRNNGEGVFFLGPVFDVGEVAARRSPIIMSDLDSDGRLDLITASGDGATTTLHIVRNLGDLTFDEPIDIPVQGSFAFNIAVGDLDGDGQPDMLVTTWGPMYQFLNATPIDNPRLSVGSLVRGQAAEFVVTGAEPDETVHFLYTLAGQGTSLGQRPLGGITLDLLAPIVHFGSAMADAQGEATLLRSVPLNAPLRPVTFQSVIRRGPEGEDSVKSRFQVRLIED